MPETFEPITSELVEEAAERNRGGETVGRLSVEFGVCRKNLGKALRDAGHTISGGRPPGKENWPKGKPPSRKCGHGCGRPRSTDCDCQYCECARPVAGGVYGGRPACVVCGKTIRQRGGA
jgi:hypothetical protein